MKRKPNISEKDRLNSFLNEKVDVKKIETQSDEMKRRLARQELFRNAPNERTFGEMFKGYIKEAKNRAFEMYRYYTRPHNKHLIMLSAFVIFSTYVCYQMEDRYYKMREHVESTKSFKQQQIEKEKRYLNNVLARNASDFKSVPISEQYDAKIKYKFEHFDGNADVDTKSELFTAMRNDYMAGKEIP